MRGPPGRLGRHLERRVQRKGLRPRYFAAVIAALWGVGVVVFGVVERLVDPDTFDTVWLAMWWAIQTVTTVGYGDAVPANTAGKLIGSLLMLGGLSLYAVVTGVITSVFVARAQADRDAAEGNLISQELELMNGQLQAMKAELARLERETD
jgi:voltage-gated potassium channel